MGFARQRPDGTWTACGWPRDCTDLNGLVLLPSPRPQYEKNHQEAMRTRRHHEWHQWLIRGTIRRVKGKSERAPSQKQERPVFRTLSVGSSRPRRTVHLFIVTSIALHVGVLGLLSLHRRAVSQTAEVQVRVALVAPSALRTVAKEAPPASRPVEKRPPARTVQPRQAPRPLLAPREVVPVTQPQTPTEEPEPEDSAEEGSSGGGSGVPSGGGDGSGPAMASAPPPARPVVKPPAPVFESEANVRRRRIAGHDPVYPLKAERNGIEGVVVAKVIVGPDGRVSDVIVMQANPVFEASVRDAIAGWQFTPLVVNGKAATVYTIFRFTFKLS